MVMVGATIVGAIGTAWHGDIKRMKRKVTFDYSQETMSKTLRQGDEMGFFKLGSTVVLLFAEGSHVQWDSALKVGSPVRFGQAMGTTDK